MNEAETKAEDYGGVVRGDTSQGGAKFHYKATFCMLKVSN
jgi:hypothetical protein